MYHTEACVIGPSVTCYHKVKAENPNTGSARYLPTEGIQMLLRTVNANAANIVISHAYHDETIAEEAA